MAANGKRATKVAVMAVSAFNEVAMATNQQSETPKFPKLKAKVNGSLSETVTPDVKCRTEQEIPRTKRSMWPGSELKKQSEVTVESNCLVSLFAAGRGPNY